MEKLKNRKVEGHRPAVWLATRARCGRPRSDDARLASVSKTLGKARQVLEGDGDCSRIDTLLLLAHHNAM